MQPKDRTPLRVRLLAYVLVGAVTFGFGEAAAAMYYTLRDGGWTSAATRLSQQRNSFLGELAGSRAECRYVDGLFPHPYVGFVHHPFSPCNLWINNIGLFGRDFPAARSANAFQILLTGGSVAAQLGQTQKGGPLFLEEELNRCYTPPHGTKFLVFNGADGAWKQPQQAILTMIYGGAFDAVVTLDGFNEHYILRNPFVRLEVPAPNFREVNPLATGSYKQIAATWVANELIAAVSATPIVRHSHLVFAIVDVIRGRLMGVAQDSSGARSEFLTGFFAFPKDWDEERRAQFNTERYQQYVRYLAAIARLNRARVAFFIQPVPAIEKPLTESELHVVGDLSYKDAYLRLVKDLTALRSEGLDVFDLTPVFRDNQQTIYADSIHFAPAPGSFESLGNRIMATHMADRLASSWGLAKTCR